MKKAILAGMLAALAVLAVTSVSSGSRAPSSQAVLPSGDHPIGF